jgi:hypothetical protein
MCKICEKQKLLATKTLETKKLAGALLAARDNFFVAHAAKNRAGADSARAEYHHLVDQLLDIGAQCEDLSSEIILDTIEMAFGDQKVHSKSMN